MKRSYKLMVYLDKHQYLWEGNNPEDFRSQQEYKLSSILGLLLIYPYAVMTNNFWKLCNWLDNAFKITEDPPIKGK